MSARLATSLAWSVCAASLMFMTFSLLLIVLGWSTPLPRGWTSWQDQTISLVGIIGAPILGGLVASRRPENPYGWLWLGFGLGLTLQQLAQSYAAYAIVVEPGSLVAPRTISHALEVGGPVGLTLVPFLLLLFPTGRLPSRRWRFLAWIVVVSGLVLIALNIAFARPDQAGGSIATITSVVVLTIFATIVLSALSLVVRYRRVSGVERQQLKWFALAAVLGGAFIVGQVLSFFVGRLLGLHWLLGETLWNILGVATQTGLYAAAGVAILRYRLYDIDIIINRTLVYGSLTASLALVYFGGVATTQAVFRALTGQEQQPQLAVVISTLVIAAVFSPLRRRIQSFIDRRFYRRKYDARKTLDGFSAKLRDETNLESLNDELIGVVRETMQPAHVSLWLRPDTASNRDEVPG